jgi:FKBP-type peptidyl-prolyl cis-trans isomerase
VDLLVQGIREVYSGKESLFSTELSDSIMVVLQEEMIKKETMANRSEIEKTQNEGKLFLDENRNKEGVVELPSGLQYKIVEEGEGESPKATDVVTVHYKGMLLDGTVFDSSYERNETISFALDRVILGWTEGLQLMSPGAKYIFYIPPELGYGDRNVGPIPAGSTLIFEVELFSVEKK